MATNNGGSNNYNPYGPPKQDSGIPSGYKVAVAIVLSLSFTAVLVQLIRFLLRSLKEQGPADGRAPAPSNGGNSDRRGAAREPRVRQPPPAVAVEVHAGPLVCTYRRADGWREATCPVCLSELADGEVVRVLPACMHYFHAACADEWLRARPTCPLCRAASA